MSPAATKARSILHEHWNGLLPVDIGDLVRATGVQVARTPADFSDPGFCATLTQGSDCKPIILYDGAQSIIRKRFAVAHALGHHALGHGTVPPDTVAHYSSDISDLLERDANIFAGEILVPGKTLVTLVNTGKFKNCKDLAAAFAVSELLLSKRMLAEFRDYIPS